MTEEERLKIAKIYEDFKAGAKINGQLANKYRYEDELNTQYSSYARTYAECANKLKAELPEVFE